MTKILIADDHHIVRRGLRALLESRSGWDVVSEAQDGYEAIEAVIRTSPDVVIMDSAMPRMSGIESTRRIHQLTRKTEICFFADCEEESVIAGALRVGARGIVFKSGTEQELLAAIDALSRHYPYFSWAVSESLLDHFQEHVEGPPEIALLTPRERKVVQLVAEGLSNRQVSRRLDLSIRTVEIYRGAAKRKAGVSSTADLVRYAVRNRLVEP